MQRGLTTVQARISVEGRDVDFESLWDWLRNDPDLRGRLKLSAAAPVSDAMGASTDVLIQAGAAMAGAGAMWVALARSLSVWLVQRRSDLTITVTGPTGRKVTVAAKRVADAEQMLLTVLRPDSTTTSRPPAEDS
jgi:hypothetical protein